MVSDYRLTKGRVKTILMVGTILMVEFGTSSAFREWVGIMVLGNGFGVRGIKVKSRDCTLASYLVRAPTDSVGFSQWSMINFAVIDHFDSKKF